MFNLHDKVIVVTGSTQGLGEDIARLATELGAAGLVICGRNAANGERIAAELTAVGTPTHYVRADFANVEDCRAVAPATSALGASTVWSTRPLSPTAVRSTIPRWNCGRTLSPLTPALLSC